MLAVSQVVEAIEYNGKSIISQQSFIGMMQIFGTKKKRKISDSPFLKLIKHFGLVTLMATDVMIFYYYVLQLISQYSLVELLTNRSSLAQPAEIVRNF